MTSRSRYLLASALLFVILSLLVLTTFRKYGISWDEGTHDRFGVYILRYYRGLLTGKPDLTVLSIGNPVAYGGVFNLITAWFQEHSPLGRFETRHLFTAVIGLSGIFGCWMFTRRVVNEKAAFWAALFLGIVPLYYGHMFFNPKDIPFASLYIWSLYFIFRTLEDFPKLSWTSVLGTGILSGLTMGMRVGGVMLYGYLGLGLICILFVAWNQYDRKTRWLMIRKALLIGVITFTFSYVIMVAFWPWALQNPLVNPLLALTAQQNIDYQGVVLFHGAVYPGDQLPWNYIPGYFLATLPEIILIMLAGGLVLGVASLIRTPSALKTPTYKFYGISLLLLAIIFPVGYAILTRPVLYDGVRHFMFILPPIASLAGISFQALSDWLSKRNLWGTRILTIGVTGLILYQIFIMARLFPYEYIDYNVLTGGVQGAYQNYELDYWGLSTSEAARWLSNYSEKEKPLGDRKIPVFTCAGKLSASAYFSQNLGIVEDIDKAHYAILLNRPGCDWNAPGKVLYRIERMGVPLAEVKELE